MIISFVPHAAPEPSSSPRALPSSELSGPWKAQGPPLHPLPSGSLPPGIASSVQSRAEPSGHSLASLQSRYLTSLTLFRRPWESRKEVGNWQVCAYCFWLAISRGFLEVRLITSIYISAPTTPLRQRWREVGTGQMRILLLTQSPSLYRTLGSADAVLSHPEEL